MTDDTAPKRIWLQTGGSYAEAYEASVGTDTGVTWCAHCVHDNDQEYVRADLYGESLDPPLWLAWLFVLTPAFYFGVGWLIWRAVQ